MRLDAPIPCQRPLADLRPQDWSRYAGWKPNDILYRVETWLTRFWAEATLHFDLARADLNIATSVLQIASREEVIVGCTVWLCGCRRAVVQVNTLRLTRKLVTFR